MNARGEISSVLCKYAQYSPAQSVTWPTCSVCDLPRDTQKQDSGLILNKSMWTYGNWLMGISSCKITCSLTVQLAPVGLTKVCYMIAWRRCPISWFMVVIGRSDASKLYAKRLVLVQEGLPLMTRAVRDRSFAFVIILSNCDFIEASSCSTYIRQSRVIPDYT